MILITNLFLTIFLYSVLEATDESESDKEILEYSLEVIKKLSFT